MSIALVGYTLAHFRIIFFLVFPCVFPFGLGFCLGRLVLQSGSK